MQFNTGETSESLKKEYNPDGSILRRCQLRLLDMLCYFDSVCKKLGIEYRIDSGCVLGAVRHKGFIPWDDDIDVVIEKKDEIKLADYLLNSSHPHYVLCCHKTDSNYLYPWMSLRDLKSEYIQKSAMHIMRKYRGLQIDIFTEQFGVIKPLFIFSKKLTAFNNHFLLGKAKVLSKMIYYFQKICFDPLFFGITKMFGNRAYRNFSYGIFWWHPFENEIVCPSKPILFEGRYFPGPANPEKYLEIVYGKNYMDLPPKDKRNWHQASYRIED